MTAKTNTLTKTTGISLRRFHSNRAKIPPARGGLFQRLATLLSNECSRRRPARVHVGEIQSVELRPQNVALRAQSCVRLVLFFARASVLDDPAQCEIGIFRRLREATSKIVEATG